MLFEDSLSQVIIPVRVSEAALQRIAQTRSRPLRGMLDVRIDEAGYHPEKAELLQWSPTIRVELFNDRRGVEQVKATSCVSTRRRDKL